jgi:hypothetical protein
MQGDKRQLPTFSASKIDAICQKTLGKCSREQELTTTNYDLQIPILMIFGNGLATGNFWDTTVHHVVDFSFPPSSPVLNSIVPSLTVEKLTEAARIEAPSAAASKFNRDEILMQRILVWGCDP